MDDGGWRELSGWYAVDLLFEMFASLHFPDLRRQWTLLYWFSWDNGSAVCVDISFVFSPVKMLLDVWEIMTEFYLVQ